jgi:hypothetical protein
VEYCRIKAASEANKDMIPLKPERKAELEALKSTKWINQPMSAQIVEPNCYTIVFGCHHHDR